MIELQTGCRIHFGLMELAESAPRRYAGLGVMLADPKLRIQVAMKDRPQDFGARNFGGHNPVVNDLSQRVESWIASRSDQPMVEVLESYPMHCGLGTGTQLAALLTVAGQLIDARVVLDDRWRSIRELLPALEGDELAIQSRRGSRSGIGIHGFLNGGLILDGGVEATGASARRQTISYRVPPSWRFVLLRAWDSSGITGQREHDLMQCLAKLANPRGQEMWQLAGTVCRAAERSDFLEFTNCLEQYLDHASRLFSPAQGGHFNGDACAAAAAEAKEVGLRAIGQSSWGPTIFGVSPDCRSAQTAAHTLREAHPDWVIEVAEPAVCGAHARRAQVKQTESTK